MNDFLQQVYWGNTVQAYAIALGFMLLTWLIFKLAGKRIIKFLTKLTAKTKTQYDDVILSTVDKFVLTYIYLFINYQILLQLTLSARVEKVANVAFAFVTAVFAIRLINHVLHKSVDLYMQYKNEPPERMRQLNGILLVIKACIWIFGIIMLIGNLGYDITTIVAGLGVGGIAIALAAQNILGDLFSYFVIFFDKPFEIGDFIIIGDSVGTVERIGIKTSHVRAISGEQLVMPNAELVKSVIKNFKRLKRRRVVFATGVLYETDEDLLEEIPGIIENIVKNSEQLTFDRCHLKEFGNFSVNFETVYFVETPDYVTYMNEQQRINIEMFRIFKRKDIGFAYPTQTLYVSGLEENNKNEFASLVKSQS